MTEAVTRRGTRAAVRAALVALALPALGAGGPAYAQPAPDATRYNTVELQADAQREVSNDSFNAVLYV